MKTKKRFKNFQKFILIISNYFNKNKMNIKEARNIIGKKTYSEILEMQKNLNYLKFINTTTENRRLKACNLIINKRKKNENKI